VTFGPSAPTVGLYAFAGITAPQTVTVKVPYGSAAAYDTAWQTTFKGSTDKITLVMSTY
jgi:hypothetical protein